MASISEMGKALTARKFELTRELTLEHLYELMAQRRNAFQMPFELKGGIGGPRIAFKKEPNLDVMLAVTIKDNTVKVMPSVATNRTGVSMGGFSMDVGKNSVLRKGVKGVLDRPDHQCGGPDLPAAGHPLRRLILHPKAWLYPHKKADREVSP